MQTKNINCQTITQLGNLICEFDLENGPWIAGGTARRLWYGEQWENNDIDIFFPNSSSFINITNTIEQIMNYEYKKLAVLTAFTTNAKSYSFKLKNTHFIKIQTVKLNYYDSLQKVFDDFDLTICKFATDGRTIIASNDALQDCEDKIMRINPTCPKKLSAARIMKYSSYGFDAESSIMRRLSQQYATNELDLKYGY